MIPGLTWATTYQVGPGKTHAQISNVTNLLNPGDTVLVQGDASYSSVQFTRPGTSEKPIVVRGIRVNGKRPVISGGTNSVHFRAAHHSVFEGFEVTGGSSRCVFHESDDLVLRDLLVRDCPAHGVLGADIGSGDLLLEFSEVTRCGSGDRLHQIYVTTDEVNYPGSTVRIQHNFIHDAKGGNNIKSRAERNEIRYNWIEGAYYHELELIGPDPGGVDDDWSPRLAREDSEVIGNVFRKVATTANNNPDFSVFRIGGDATGESHGRYRFIHNTVLAGTGAVFRCFDSLESVEMHNNVFHHPGGSLNLMRTVEANWTQGQPIIAGQNNWITAGAANIPDAWQGTLEGDAPGFLNLSLLDLRPDSASVLRMAAQASPPGLDDFPFPNPLTTPEYSPPLRSAILAPIPRPSNVELAIGALETESPASIHQNYRVQHHRNFLRAKFEPRQGTFIYWNTEAKNPRRLNGRVSRSTTP
jgi:hypothetical protein